MAAPAKQRPGRYLGLVALVLVALYLALFLGPADTPALGLDLRGGTEITLTASPIGAGKVTKSALSQAVNIIRDRAAGIGVSNASVSTQGSSNIVVQVPGKGRSVLETIGETALLRFRQVLTFAAPSPTPTTTASPSESPSPNVSTSTGKHSKPKTTKKSTKKKKNTTSGLAVSSALTKPNTAAKSTASPKSTATPTATPSATPTVSPSPGPSPTPTSATAGTQIQPLPNSQSPTLTPAFEQAFASWDCLSKNNPTQGADNPADYIISCGTAADGFTKYLLAPAAVEGTQVTGATAGLGDTSQWQVNLSFNGSGATAWQKVTEKAYNVNNGVASQSCTPPTGCNAVAIVLDGQVVSAPFISSAGGIPGGKAQITGGFTDKTANQLANTLKYGALPLKFTPQDIQSVSATLGAAQLRGGLIAGIIGLGLVVIFSLLYYRALGFVTVGSLAVSGLILYAVTTLLGHSALHYTLSLPGIAGFIVAVGITADSFVVFFERLRDEIREGRRLRSAVDRAWPRARRTILSADTVSLLAAVVLYVVSIGDVRGFAFTLGLSTLSDLFIVFFFTKPLLMVLARRPAFDSGKSWTGIGKARAGVVREPEPDRLSRMQRSARVMGD